MQKPLRNKDKDFRYLFSNAFGFQLTGNELIVTFGINEDVSRPDESVLEQSAIVLTLPSAKLFAALLNNLLAKFETENNTVIPYDYEKVRVALDAAITKNNSPSKV